MRNSALITYSPRTDATAEAEIFALAAAYELVFESARKRGCLPDKRGSNNAIVRNTEEVGHVDQQPN